ncbi:hypothetical protein J8C06_05860 [Chloracidobacterium validum]|uniref:Uncharacterized protein n=1 Tax=Chloracidobacterium validum TaxID=2821543 RepID=A0ABX8B891_9BACT|nr:hypothetical protein J8C06_05860 [Chloracidobacterium validum]
MVWRFWIGYGLLAAAYLVTLGYRPYPGSFLVKALPVLFATGWVYGRARARTCARTWQVSCGLAWSAVGDVFLALDDRFFSSGWGPFSSLTCATLPDLRRSRESTRGLPCAPAVSWAMGLGWDGF